MQVKVKKFLWIDAVNKVGVLAKFVFDLVCYTAFFSALTQRSSKWLVFSVTPLKIDQNKNQNRSIDKVQKPGHERRCIHKDPSQDSGQRNISYTRYPKKCFTQTYKDLYGDAKFTSFCNYSVLPSLNKVHYYYYHYYYFGAHLNELQHGGQKPTETSVTEFCYKSVNLFFEKLINIKAILLLIHKLFR